MGIHLGVTMSHTALAALFALGLGLAVPLVAAESTEHGALATLNSHCVMCGSEVGASPVLTKLTVGEGTDAKSFYLACESKPCAEALLKDPAPVLKKTFGKDAPGAKTMGK